MPPRIPLFQCLKAPNVTPLLPSTRSFTSSSHLQASTITQRRKNRDPYAQAQAKARKAANRSRQEVLQKERAEALGDPVRGVTTPYLESFDTGIAPEPTTSPTATKTRIPKSPDPSAPGPKKAKSEHLNFFLTPTDLSTSLSRSKYLTTPTPDTSSEASPPEKTAAYYTTSTTPEQRATSLAAEQATATEALTRIASLSLGSSKDRLRVNKQRCISTFGRHNTDAYLPPKPASAQTSPPSLSQLPPTPRVGPDTGSSEVQIAILTAKIRTLAGFLETRGKMDKANKRNLRLLVHRRQKLMRYLRRKERGGGRWRNVVDTLGLTEGMWRGEITL